MRVRSVPLGDDAQRSNHITPLRWITRRRTHTRIKPATPWAQDSRTATPRSPSFERRYGPAQVKPEIDVASREYYASRCPGRIRSCGALADADEPRSEPLLDTAAAVDVVAEACAGSGSVVVAEFNAAIAIRAPRYEAPGIYVNRTDGEAVASLASNGQEAQGSTKLKPKPTEKDNRRSVLSILRRRGSTARSLWMQSLVERHQGGDGDWDKVSEAMCSFSFWFGCTGADGYAPQVILLVVVGEEEHLDGQYETVGRQA
jgi:hypothetical protein